MPENLNEDWIHASDLLVAWSRLPSLSAADFFLAACDLGPSLFPGPFLFLDHDPCPYHVLYHHVKTPLASLLGDGPSFGHSQRSFFVNVLPTSSQKVDPIYEVHACH